MAVTIPSSTKAGLPNTPAAGDLERVTDNVQGVWMADGTTLASWFSLLGEVVNVKDFGATGDGVTDDGPAIQAAITASTGIVYLPPGTYVCEDEITLKIGLTILGAGVLNSEVRFTENTRGFVYEPPGMTEAQIRLSGFQIVGHSAALELVYIKQAAMLNFDELIIRDTNETCLYLENCYNTVMYHLKIAQADHYGIHLKGGESTPTNVWTIIGCNFQPHVDRVGLASLYIEASGFGGVRDCNFEGGIETEPPAGTNNAILLKGATNVEVAANFMELFRFSVIDFRDVASSGIRIALNAIHSGRPDPDHLIDAGSGSLAHDFVIVEQNRFGGVTGCNCYNPGQTATFAYRMNFKDFSGGAHVAGFVEANVEKFPSAIRQKEARLLNEGSISGATPSIANLQYVEVNNGSPVTMTGLTGGARDQLVILHFGNGNTTVQNGNFKLAGKANKTFASLDTLTLLNIDGGSTWVEVCRSIN